MATSERKREQARERARRWRKRWPEKHKERCAAWHDKRDPSRSHALMVDKCEEVSDLFFLGMLNHLRPRRDTRSSYQRRTTEQLEADRNRKPLSIAEELRIAARIEQEIRKRKR